MGAILKENKLWYLVNSKILVAIPTDANEVTFDLMSSKHRGYI